MLKGSVLIVSHNGMKSIIAVHTLMNQCNHYLTSSPLNDLVCTYP